MHLVDSIKSMPMRFVPNYKWENAETVGSKAMKDCKKNKKVSYIQYGYQSDW